MKIKNLFPFNNPFGLHKTNFLKKRDADWQKIKFWGIRLGITLLGFILLLFAWYAKDLPTPGKIKHRQAVSATQIFDRNGKEIYSYYGDVKRIVIDSNEIPLTLKQATITAEDRNFYHHFGIDIKGLARAVYQDFILRKKNMVGGSTITQQYVKNALLDNKKTFDRKAKELILSLEIEAMYSKDQILTMYLNEIPYGSNYYGIEAASENYFGKKAKDLTLAESATLAALPQAPTYYSPYGVHPDKREERINWILDSMADQKYITREQANQAKFEAKNLSFNRPQESVSAPHFAMYVKDLLVEQYGEQMVDEGGLKVTTTLDLDKQAIAEQVVKNSQKRLNGLGASNAALVSIDPKTGQILAMVGSIDFYNKDIDGQVNVADSLRQPGSSFKPIVYATAFKGKYNPAFTLWDVTTDFGGGYTPKNYDGQTHGPVSMRMALAGSLNIPAVKTLALAGIEKAIDTAHDLGITTLNGKPANYGLPLVLGSGEVKLVDLTTAYGVFANQGKLVPTNAILKVEDSRGKVLDDFKVQDGKQVLDPQIAYEISSILSDDNARSFVFGSNSVLTMGGRPVAAKTGTTSDYKDAWTMGYTPSLVTGVWVGNNRGKQMAQGSAGAMAAAPIWHDYMTKALESTPAEQFNRPSGISEVTVDKLSNKLPSTYSTDKITDIFASWQVPTTLDDIHVVAKIDKLTGKLATPGCPSAYTQDKLFANVHSEFPDRPNWEAPVLAAASELGISVNSISNETACSNVATTTTKAAIKIISPKNNSGTTDSVVIQTQVVNVTGTAQVTFYLDNKKLQTVTSEPYALQISGLSLGRHRVSVNLVDQAGNSATDSIDVIGIKSTN